MGAVPAYFFLSVLEFRGPAKSSVAQPPTTLDALYPIAYSGVEYAKSLVHADTDPGVDTLADPWSFGVPDRVDMVYGSFALGAEGQAGLVDEERKINLNEVNAEILSRLLRIAAGLDEQKAQALAYGLLDWADSDSFYSHPQYGAESGEYENLKFPYTAKNLPYESIDELLLVKGMTPELFEQIKPFVTVYGTGAVNINTAPREVLAALGLNTKTVSMILRYRAGSDGKEGTADDGFFTGVNNIANTLKKQESESPLDGDQEVLLATLLEAARLGINSKYFSVKSHAVLTKNGASLDIEAVMDRLGSVRYCRASEVHPAAPAPSLSSGRAG